LLREGELSLSLSQPLCLSVSLAGKPPLSLWWGARLAEEGADRGAEQRRVALWVQEP